MSDPLHQSRVDHYDRTYRSVRGRVRPATVYRSESGADIISKTRGFLGGFDFTMQFQVGCPGGCLFCYVSSAPRLAPTPVRERWGFEVREKSDVIRQLSQHLGKGTLADKMVYWSGVTDPYAVKAAVTEEVWNVLNAASPDLRPRRIVVQSRFRPDRDRHLIREYSESTKASDGLPPLVVSYSIGTDRNDLIHAWERATPTFEQRIKAIGNLRNEGIFVVPTLSPFGVWNDLAVTLRQFKEWGIPYLTVLFFKESTRYANTPRDFLNFLRKGHPQLLDPDWQQAQLEELRVLYGKQRIYSGREGFSNLVKPVKELF